MRYPRTLLCANAIALALGSLSGFPDHAALAAEVELPVSPSRTFDAESRIFRSEAEPRIALRIVPGYRYLGRLEFPLGESALVDRHYWVDAEGGKIRRLIVFQFEGFLPGVEGQYRFSLPKPESQGGSNYRYSATGIRLGGREYIHNTWAFDHEASAREGPGKESDRTLRFFAKHGLEFDAELIMSRFAGIVGHDARRELILFYMEPLAASGYSLADFPDGGSTSTVYDELSGHVTARSFEAFRVIDYPRIDTNHSTLGFEVPILRGLSRVTGKFTDYEVELVYDRKDPTESSVAVRIEATSIDTGIDQRDQHLRSADFFDVENYPAITFASSHVESREGGLEVTGVLSMHGVEKSLTVPFTVTDFLDGDTDWTSFSARFSLDRREFGISWSHSEIPFFVGDEVTVDLVFISR